ncbi:hypothetical protein [Gorillibacterium timonense]|uniref:hypothetical protein n=1 Tax=Gorillibacterium timonense TaxID=1689269 RepID=UPI00071DC0E7|nr:hypothetical protein [Gorillibacterium timonense]
MKRREYSNLLFILLSAVVVLATFGLFLLIDQQGFHSGHGWLTFLLLAGTELAFIRLVRGLFRQEQTSPSLVPAYLPRIVLTGCYFAAILVVAFLFGWESELAFARYLTLQLIVLGLYAALYLIAVAFQKKVAEERADRSFQTEQIRQMQRSLLSSLRILEDRKAPDEMDLLTKVRELSERFTYSDPYSHPSLAGSEDNLHWQVTQLEQCVRSLNQDNGEGNRDLAWRFAQDITADLIKRNQDLLALK